VAEEDDVLEALARNWGLVVVRGVLAVLYGMTAVLWPGFDIASFVMVFGVYSIFDGGLALALAVDVRALPGFASLFFETLIRLAGGIVAMGSPSVILTFPKFFAGWALVTGVAEITVAGVLRRELAGEWPLPVAGIFSVLVGVLVLLLAPVTIGVPGLKWVVGPYAIIVGATQLALARRLRELAQEISG
jgi:uncharacterized membrane protein HdeD (DUF308 family)